MWQPCHAADTSSNWRQSLFCCCTASMEQATDGAETAAINGLISSWSENISVSFCLWAPGYGLTLWCTLGLLVGGAIQVPQLQLHLPAEAAACMNGDVSDGAGLSLVNCEIYTSDKWEKSHYSELTNWSVIIEIVVVGGVTQCYLRCCSHRSGNDSWTAKTWHYPAGDEAGRWHCVWPAWWQGQVNLSTRTVFAKSHCQLGLIRVCVFVIVSDQPDAQQTSTIKTATGLK